jgi:hypothetical protein
MPAPITIILLYFLMPLWLLAGVADWLCHRSAHIEANAGVKESVLHLLMFAEVGVALVAGVFLQINAGVILLMMLAFFAHEATALWDVSYAVTTREVSPIEQHVHSFLELVPLMAIVCVISLHWEQFLSLFGAGTLEPDFSLQMKAKPLPTGYVISLFSCIVAFELIPFAEELFRGWRSRGTASLRPAGPVR